MWGAATSAYQVEGGIENSDWSKFLDAGQACDHYHQYPEDFDLMKKLNLKAYRFSIEWSRIEPREGEFDSQQIEHYRKVLLALKERDISPFVTLYHWPIPLWFKEKGGWLNSKSPKYFQRYVEKIVEELGPYADFWITINEPLVYSSESYLKGRWPPQERSLLKTIKVIRNLIAAHKKAYQEIHRLDSQAKVGIAKNNCYFEPYRGKLINRVLAYIGGISSNYFWNEYFFNRIKGHQDFIGLNYYFHSRIKVGWTSPGNWFNQNENEVVSDLGWEIYPRGIYEVLKGLKKYDQPIYITENGLADSQDRLRKKFIRDHLYWVYKANQEGIEVKGYFHWSLMDNFEWDKGFGPRFGLIEVDYDTLERRPRDSAWYYAKICKDNTLIKN